MKKRLKIFIAWLMLALLFYNFGFCFIVFELSVQLNRHYIEKFLSDADESQLLILKIADGSSIIRKGNHEIIFEGRGYDVKKEIKKNGTIYFYCIHDEAEENLVCALNTSVNNNSDVQNKKQSGHLFEVLKHLAKDYFHENSIVETQEIINSCKPLADNETFLSNNYFSVITPPPKVKFF